MADEAETKTKSKPQAKPQVTITKEQDILVRDMARAKWGDKHGNRSKYVREAIDEKLERDMHARQESSN